MNNDFLIKFYVNVNYYIIYDIPAFQNDNNYPFQNGGQKAINFQSGFLNLLK